MSVKDRPAKPSAKASSAPHALAPAPKAVAGRTRSDSGMRYSIVLMVPEDATRYLANSDNLDFGGSIFKRKLARFGTAMKEKRWELNGDTVVISKTGKVLDGRARLQACIDSNSAFPVILVTNVDDAAYYSIDAHSRRNTTDMLVIDEKEHAKTLASAWQAIAGYLNAPERDRFRYQGSSAVTTDEIMVLNTIYDKEIQRSAEFIAGLRMTAIIPNTVATACHFLASLVDNSEADEFFRELANPKAKKSLITSALRRRYQSTASNTTITYRMAIFSKAWRVFRQDGNFDYKTTLDFKGPVERNGNLGTEAFPIIHGLEDQPRFDFEELHKTAADDAGKVFDSYDLSSYSGVSVIEMDVTPDIGAGFLASRGKNRTVRASHVKGLARMMEARQWHSNGKTLKISDEGELIDGQHRCEAVKSLAGKNVIFRTLVVSGLPASCFHTMDLGERKSLAAKLRAGGEGKATPINSVCTILWRIANGHSGSEPTSVEAQLIYAADKKAIDESVAFVTGIRIRKTLDVSIAGALHLLFRRQDAAMADTFMNHLAKGINMDENSPIYTLREELNDDAKLARKRYNAQKKIRAVIKAWDRFVLKTSNKGLKLIDPTDTGYPDIYGPLKKG